MCGNAPAVEVDGFLITLQGLLVVSHQQLQIAQASQGGGRSCLHPQGLLVERSHQLQPLPEGQLEKSLALEELGEAGSTLGIDTDVGDSGGLDQEVGERNQKGVGVVAIEQREQSLKGLAVVLDASVAVGQRAHRGGVLRTQTQGLAVAVDGRKVVLAGGVEVADVVPREVVFWIQPQRFLVQPDGAHRLLPQVGLCQALGKGDLDLRVSEVVIGFVSLGSEGSGGDEMRLGLPEPLAFQQSAADIVEALDGGPFSQRLSIVPDGLVQLPLGASVEAVGQLQLLVVVIAARLGLLRDEADGGNFLLWEFQQVGEGHKAAIGRSPQVEQPLYLFDGVMMKGRVAVPGRLPVERVNEVEVSIVGHLQALVLNHNKRRRTYQQQSIQKVLSSCFNGIINIDQQLTERQQFQQRKIIRESLLPAGRAVEAHDAQLLEVLHHHQLAAEGHLRRAEDLLHEVLHAAELHELLAKAAVAQQLLEVPLGAVALLELPHRGQLPAAEDPGVLEGEEQAVGERLEVLADVVGLEAAAPSAPLHSLQCLRRIQYRFGRTTLAPAGSAALRRKRVGVGGLQERLLVRLEAGVGGQRVLELFLGAEEFGTVFVCGVVEEREILVDAFLGAVLAVVAGVPAVDVLEGKHACFELFNYYKSNRSPTYSRHSIRHSLSRPPFCPHAALARRLRNRSLHFFPYDLSLCSCPLSKNTQLRPFLSFRPNSNAELVPGLCAVPPWHSLPGFTQAACEKSTLEKPTEQFENIMYWDGSAGRGAGRKPVQGFVRDGESRKHHIMEQNLRLGLPTKYNKAQRSS